MPVWFEVRSASGRYAVGAERGVFQARAADLKAGVVIADRHFGARLAAAQIAAIEVEAGERAKSLDALSEVAVRMREAGATRDSHLWAVGGGAIQDIAGFLASIYMRGIEWTYVPTTLLGMVDSCIGGKSSINVGGYKNLVGTFHSPRAVIIDAELTSTLGAEQRAAGLIEAAKICFCRGEAAFERYLSLAPSCELAPAGYEAIIAASLEAKKWFVETDEFDRGERLLLNLGHTFGHGLEGASGYRLGHGIAVGVGILCAAALSEKLLGARVGGAVPALSSHLRELLGAAPSVPVAAAGIDPAQTFDRIRADKKHTAAHFRFVTFDARGRPRVEALARDEASRKLVIAAIRDTLESLTP